MTETAPAQPAPESHPDLPRARMAARVVGLIIPVGLVIVGVIVSLVWLPRLPNPVAVHWSGAGVADGFGSPALSLIMFPITGLIVAGLYFVTRVQDLQNRARPGGDIWGPINRLTPAIVLGAAVLIFSLNMVTTAIQLDLPDARQLEPNLAVTIVPAVAGLAAAVLGYFAQPRLRVSATVEADTGEPLELAPAERVAWVGTIGVSRAYLWIMGASLVVLVACLILVASIRPAEPAGISIVGASLLVVVVLTVTCMRFNVRIDERGLEARSFVGWPVMRVPADQVVTVEVGDIHPFGEFGGWGWRLSVDGKIGIVMRTGEGIRVTRRTGRPLVVTIDDAESAATALATAAQQARAGSVAPDGQTGTERANGSRGEVTE
ncbi:DUF1648 domain-containing protein [Leucobacter aridicollis]|uniref:Putative membrane protein n=1 Tax=Leucobacter aridicollis TaxID=283878 RepID=A0A852R0B2_9MICO|nr:DUF1648 domain-containing protein [Leucobacter aridicollis]MBL3682549.1 DUF1648 domain-containing protein [Leucobacter aridicollis]NYD25967.1 putative membrane protein [Leucobacter aridicollis]